MNASCFTTKPGALAWTTVSLGSWRKARTWLSVAVSGSNLRTQVGMETLGPGPVKRISGRSMVSVVMPSLSTCEQPNVNQPSSRRLRPRQQLGEVGVHPRHPEIRLAPERRPDVVDALRAFIEELDDAQDEVLGLVERVEDLVAGHGDGGGARDAALHLDEAQLAGAGDATLDVVAELVELAVGGLEAEAAFGLDDDRAGPRGGRPRVR